MASRFFREDRLVEGIFFVTYCTIIVLYVTLRFIDEQGLQDSVDFIGDFHKKWIVSLVMILVWVAYSIALFITSIAVVAIFCKIAPPIKKWLGAPFLFVLRGIIFVLRRLKPGMFMFTYSFGLIWYLTGRLIDEGELQSSVDSIGDFHKKWIVSLVMILVWVAYSIALFITSIAVVAISCKIAPPIKERLRMPSLFVLERLKLEASLIRLEGHTAVLFVLMYQKYLKICGILLCYFVFCVSMTLRLTLFLIRTNILEFAMYIAIVAWIVCKLGEFCVRRWLEFIENLGDLIYIIDTYIIPGINNFVIPGINNFVIPGISVLREDIKIHRRYYRKVLKYMLKIHWRYYLLLKKVYLKLAKRSCPILYYNYVGHSPISEIFLEGTANEIKYYYKTAVDTYHACGKWISFQISYCGSQVCYCIDIINYYQALRNCYWMPIKLDIINYYQALRNRYWMPIEPYWSAFATIVLLLPYLPVYITTRVFWAHVGVILGSAYLTYGIIMKSYEFGLHIYSYVLTRFVIFITWFFFKDMLYMLGWTLRLLYTMLTIVWKPVRLIVIPFVVIPCARVTSILVCWLSLSTYMFCAFAAHQALFIYIKRFNRELITDSLEKWREVDWRDYFYKPYQVIPVYRPEWWPNYFSEYQDSNRYKDTIYGGTVNMWAPVWKRAFWSVGDGRQIYRHQEQRYLSKHGVLNFEIQNCQEYVWRKDVEGNMDDGFTWLTLNIRYEDVFWEGLEDTGGAKTSIYLNYVNYTANEKSYKWIMPPREPRWYYVPNVNEAQNPPCEIYDAVQGCYCSFKYPARNRDWSKGPLYVVDEAPPRRDSLNLSDSYAPYECIDWEARMEEYTPDELTTFNRKKYESSIYAGPEYGETDWNNWYNWWADDLLRKMPKQRKDKEHNTLTTHNETTGQFKRDDFKKSEEIGYNNAEDEKSEEHREDAAHKLSGFFDKKTKTFLEGLSKQNETTGYKSSSLYDNVIVENNTFLEYDRSLLYDEPVFDDEKADPVRDEAIRAEDLASVSLEMTYKYADPVNDDERIQKTLTQNEIPIKTCKVTLGEHDIENGKLLNYNRRLTLSEEEPVHYDETAEIVLTPKPASWTVGETLIYDPETKPSEPFERRLTAEEEMLLAKKLLAEKLLFEKRMSEGWDENDIRMLKENISMWDFATELGLQLRAEAKLQRKLKRQKLYRDTMISPNDSEMFKEDKKKLAYPEFAESNLRHDYTDYIDDDNNEIPLKPKKKEETFSYIEKYNYSVLNDKFDLKDKEKDPILRELQYNEDSMFINDRENQTTWKNFMKNPRKSLNLDTEIQVDNPKDKTQVFKPIDHLDGYITKPEKAINMEFGWEDNWQKRDLWNQLYAILAVYDEFDVLTLQDVVDEAFFAQRMWFYFMTKYHWHIWFVH